MQNVYLREEAEIESELGDIVGTSSGIRRVFESVDQVAATDSTVLITGVSLVSVFSRLSFATSMIAGRLKRSCVACKCRTSIYVRKRRSNRS